MASFTFGSGNSRKLLGVPLYALTALATAIIPRSNRLWVFGCGIGPGEGALPLYRAARNRLDERTRLVWMARSSDELQLARSLGLDTVRKGGWRGFWLTARARVIVVTHGFGDANRYGTRGGFVVQLWHGVPLKHLHLDSPSTYAVSFLPDHGIVRRLVGYAYRRAGRGISMFPVAGPSVAPHIASAFGVPPERIVVTGDIRDDVLLAGSEEDRKAAAHELLAAAAPDLPAGSRVVLFAPTWRDGHADPTVPTAEEWQSIAGWLERHDAVLLVRTHPLGRGDFGEGPRVSSRIRMLDLDALRELNHVLWAVDVVVTDYSSVVFDFALVSRPVVFFAPDLEAYARSRGFYRSYAWFSGGRSVATWADVLVHLGEALDEDAGGTGHRHAQAIRREIFQHRDGRAADRVLDEVVRQVGATASPPPQSSGPALEACTAAGDATGIHVRLRSAGSIQRARLVGTRAAVDVELDRDGDRVNLAVPLLTSRWGNGPLALPSGSYRLELDDGAIWLRGAAELPPLQLRHPLFRADVSLHAGDVTLQIGPPLTDDERSRRGQRRLERRYRRTDAPLEDAVFLESFYGRSAACNPLGIDASLTVLRPATRRYWSVIDGSVAVPQDAIAVVQGSAAWWQARATSRVLVVNDWLRQRYRRHGEQRVLQTWHGTTLKRLARDRPDAGWRSRIASRREGARWDALLAQNEFSVPHLRSAYAFTGPVWVDGYPRNDVLAHPDRAADVRTRLGIPADAHVVLYAPTWREDRDTMIDVLDPATLASSLPPGGVVLVRGHSRTQPQPARSAAPEVLDVSDYPDMADMLLVADVFVTDYSSSMFDWMSTGRPIIFFVPDLARYRDDVRGFYADLLADPPGPVVSNVDGLIDAVHHAAGRAAAYAEVAAEWRRTYAPLDDGEAGRRVVERLIAEGWLD